MDCRFALAVTTGVGAVLDIEIKERVRVWYWNQEDAEDELDRRLASARIFHGIEDSQLERDGESMLFVNSGTHNPFMLAKRGQNGALTQSPDVARIVAHIRANDIGLFILDPLAEVHEGEENDNSQMKMVWATVRTIAELADCAVLVAAHSRKPDQASSDGYAGDLNSLRGASSQGGMVRAAFTLLNMSEKDAKSLGVPEKERHLYVKLNDAKGNWKLATGAARWLKRVSVDIDPEAPDDLGPEMVGCLVPVTLKSRVKVEAPKLTCDELFRVIARALAGRADPSAAVALNKVVDGMSPEDQATMPAKRHRAEVVTEALAEGGFKTTRGVAVVPVEGADLIVRQGGQGAPTTVQLR